MKNDDKPKRKGAGDLIDETGKESFDPEVKNEFQEAGERLEHAGRRWRNKLADHHSSTPELSGGDVDADWERAGDVGEEGVAGSVSTPDQDIVEEIGEALGVTYQDTEPLQGSEKLHERDRKRWELDPASSDDYQDRAREQAPRKKADD